MDTKQAMNNMGNKVQDTVRSGADAAKREAKDLASDAKSTWETAQDKMSDVQDVVQDNFSTSLDWVRSNPLPSIIGVGIAGFLLGRMTR